MIPLKIQLKNFLSYGSDLQTIDLSTYPLICLSGKNGHGKSALLDAITWAIWGQARKTAGTAKADSGLVRIGQTQMMVILDFEFNNQLYRVRREFALTYGKPYAALDFGLVDSNDALIPLTDKTISLTQAKIENTLNLTFDSFINSAFLRQGQSNEFSKKSPKERKEILAAILGLDKYETIRKLALEKARAATNQKTSRTLLIEQLLGQLQKKEEITQALDALNQQLVALQEQDGVFTATTKELAKQQQQLAQKQTDYQVVQFAYDQLRTKQQEHQAQLRDLYAHYKQMHRLQLQARDLHSLELHKQQLVAAIKGHQDQLQKSLEIKEQILAYKEKIQTRTIQIQSECAQAQQKQKNEVDRLAIEKQVILNAISHLEKQLLTGEQELSTQNNQLVILQTAQTTFKSDQQKFQAIEKQFEKRKECFQKFLEQGRFVTQELESLEQKKQLAHDDDDPSCPLCEQNLSAARKRFLKQKFVEQEKSLQHRLRRLTQLVKKLKQILVEQHQTLEQHTKNNQSYAISISQIEQTTNHIKKTHAANTQLTEQLAKQKTDHSLLELQHTNAQQELALLIHNNQQILQDDATYKTLIGAASHLEKEFAQISYNQATHQTAQTQLATVEKQLAHYHEIMQQEAVQEQRKATIGTLCEQLKNIKQQITEKQTALAQYAQLSAQLATHKQQVENQQSTLEKHAQTKQQIAQEQMRLQTQLGVLAKQEAEYQEQQKLIKEFDEIAADYQLVANATGKDGIQALLIEDAIPEIEEEANNLLSRLSNNQAQIFIESLKDLKKGGTKETLDIKISDAMGIRAYELFSGGEAFRIDFALRIAISKLLARRAGTSLQTLIIDEGFGSQDEEGLGLIMDALYKIQEDFSKIIIVSHLNSMKDQFPVHLVIEKGPQGSTVTIQELG